MKGNVTKKMLKKNRGPFKRSYNQKQKKLRIHAPLIGTALALIAMCQIPITVQTSFNIFCILKSEISSSSTINLCKKFQNN